MRRTRLFGPVAALGATVALTFAAASPASAETVEERTRPLGSVSLSDVDVDQNADDAEQTTCAIYTDRTEVRVRVEPTTDSEYFDYLEPGEYYEASCDSTPGGEYGDPCGDGFHWVEVYIGDTVGYAALMCLDGWVQVDV